MKTTRGIGPLHSMESSLTMEQQMAKVLARMSLPSALEQIKLYKGGSKELKIRLSRRLSRLAGCRI